MENSKSNDNSENENIELKIDHDEGEIELFKKLANQMGISVEELINLALKKYKEKQKKGS